MSTSNIKMIIGFEESGGVDSFRAVSKAEQKRTDKMNRRIFAIRDIEN